MNQRFAITAILAFAVSAGCGSNATAGGADNEAKELPRTQSQVEDGALPEPAMWTDATLQRLKGSTQLRKLDLTGAPVTDAGVEHLKGLTQLQELGLSGAQVTDAGVERLKGLTNLRDLTLCYSQVTDAGLMHLKG